MDYFFLSTLQHNPPDRVLVLYDISCQWAHNFIKRLLVYPVLLATIFWTLLITYIIPKFHLAAHMLLCHASFSLNFTPHVGQTDREAPEHQWASTNAMANSTKEMGPGSQCDTLDDYFGDYNW
jgi:Kyakuja-Dileera-Zisupton transposase